MTTKTVVTVHATMTPPSRQPTLRDIDKQHRRAGYRRCCYHFVIRSDGTVETGKPSGEPSLMDKGADVQQAISVCLVGGLATDGNPEDNFTAAQWDSLRVTVEGLMESQWPLLGGTDGYQIKSVTAAVTTKAIKEHI